MKRTLTLVAALSVAGLGFAAISTDAVAHGKKSKSSHSWASAKASKHDAIRSHKSAKMQAWEEKKARKREAFAAKMRAWEEKKARKREALESKMRSIMEWKSRKTHKFSKKAPTPLG